MNYINFGVTEDADLSCTSVYIYFGNGISNNYNIAVASFEVVLLRLLDVST